MNPTEVWGASGALRAERRPYAKAGLLVAAPQIGVTLAGHVGGWGE